MTLNMQLFTSDQNDHFKQLLYSFQLVSFVLIGVAAYGRLVAVVVNLSLVGGVIACGVFLFIVAVIGLIGAVRHHQVLLFFVSFLIQKLYWYQVKEYEFLYKQNAHVVLLVNST